MSTNGLSSIPNGSGDTKRVVTVLAVEPKSEDRRTLEEIFQHSNWKVWFVATCADARIALRNKPQSIVICEASLPDGSWQDVLQIATAMPAPPPIIVTSLQADDWLWAEVLNLGGYDVLAKPFDSKEVVRITSLAWLHWRDRVGPLPKPPAEVELSLKAAC